MCKCNFLKYSTYASAHVGCQKKNGCTTFRKLSFLDVVHSPVLKLITYSTPFPLRNIFICTRFSGSKDFDG
jgi:hypothetical protein